jgi:hypothetical protein
LGSVGLDWSLGGFATASMGSSGNSPASTSQLVQAMAGFGGSGASESLSTATLSAADTSQQPRLTRRSKHSGQPRFHPNSGPANGTRLPCLEQVRYVANFSSFFCDIGPPWPPRRQA